MQVVVMNLDSCFTCFKKSLDFLKMKKKMLERMLERMMESMMEMMAFFKMKGMLLEMKRMKMLQYLRMNLIMLLKRMKMMKLAFSKMKMESLLLEMERKRRQERMLLRFWKMSLMLLEQMILLLESMMMNLMLLALIQIFYFDCLMIDCCYSSMSQLSHYSLVYHQQSNLSQFHWQKCYYYSTCSKGFPILPTKYRAQSITSPDHQWYSWYRWQTIEVVQAEWFQNQRWRLLRIEGPRLTQRRYSSCVSFIIICGDYIIAEYNQKQYIGENMDTKWQIKRL